MPNVQQLKRLMKTIDGPRPTFRKEVTNSNVAPQNTMREISNNGAGSSTNDTNTRNGVTIEKGITRPPSPLTDVENDPRPPKKRKRGSKPPVAASSRLTRRSAKTNA